MQYTQRAWYMPQINQSQTNQSILAETMCRSLQIPQEAKKNSIAITHDLATPKIAIQIQKEESLVYGNMFIALLQHHLKLCMHFKTFSDSSRR